MSQTEPKIETSLYEDVGGVAKITDATFCWYHGMSAKTKHLK